MTKAKELKTLNEWFVGQTVVVWGSFGRMRLEKITRITDGRGGTIYVGDTVFNVMGSERSNDTWNKNSISPATDRDIKIINLQHKRDKIQRFKWSELSEDRTNRVYDIICEQEKEKVGK